MKRIREAEKFAASVMAATQQKMEAQTKCSGSTAPSFRVGDKVWLNLGNIKTPQPKKKLAWINAKYEVTNIISPDVVELEVPSGIYPRFYVQILKQACEDPHL